MRKDDILREFLKHNTICQDEKIVEGQLPTTVAEGLSSKIPIIKTLALIVDKLEGKQVPADPEIYRQVAYFLKTSNATV